MRILITGASGLLGRRMFDIISKSHETVGTYNQNNNGDFHYLDITDRDSVDLFSLLNLLHLTQSTNL